MTRMILGLAVFVSGACAASAQQGYPVPGPLNYLPYYTPPATSTVGRPPLSPYLNLLNGNNPALNYYYGVRPLLPGAGMPRGGFQQSYQNPATPGGFFQPTSPKAAPYPEPDDTKKFTLPSPGGPVSFGNSFGSSRAGVVGGRTGYFSGAKGGGTAPPANTPPTIPKSK